MQKEPRPPLRASLWYHVHRDYVVKHPPKRVLSLTGKCLPFWGPGIATSGCGLTYQPGRNSVQQCKFRITMQARALDAVCHPFVALRTHRACPSSFDRCCSSFGRRCNRGVFFYTYPLSSREGATYISSLPRASKRPSHTKRFERTNGDNSTNYS